MYNPTNEDDLSKLIAGLNGPVAIAGGGTRDVGQAVDGDTLCVGGLTGVTLYEPGALTLVAGAGTPMSEIEAVLATENQRLAFEPMDHRRLLGTSGAPTIGGCVAANVSGPRRVVVGACRDHLLGVRFVDGRGRVISNGGRVMKNVTGYDLVKLMAGSWGTLGVLSEVSLKVLPVPEVARTLRIDVVDVGAALTLMQRAMGTPYEVTGAAYRDGAVMLRVEGFEDQVAYRINELRGLFGGDVAEVDWDGIRDVVDLADKPVVWKISLRPSQMGDMLDQIGGDVLLDWGGGLAWVGFDADEASRGQIHQLAARLGGHATLIKAPAELRANGVFQPEPAAVAALTQGVRQKFDPRGLLNPGRMS